MENELLRLRELIIDTLYEVCEMKVENDISPVNYFEFLKELFLRYAELERKSRTL